MRKFDFVPDGTQECNVTAWIHDEGESEEMARRKLPAVIICPGGGYSFVSAREADPVAPFYYAAGYHTFVLRYAVGEKAKDFYPLCQLAATMAHIRKHAEELCVDINKIAVCGFSAGGHLAGSLGTLANTEEFKSVFGREDVIRPNAMLLVYPVITADAYAHTGSIQNVSGCEIGSEGYQWFALNEHVDSHTPPTFLCHATDDTCVPVQNSLRMAEALSSAGIPYEVHILPSGGHGFSVCTETVGCRDDYKGRWVDWSIQWLNRLFDFHG